MTPADTVLLVRYVKAMCPAQMVDEYTPEAWHRVVGDLRLADCQNAIVALKRGNNPPPFIDVGEIRKAVRVARNDRIERGPAYTPESGLSLAEWNRRVADDELPPRLALPAAVRPDQDAINARGKALIRAALAERRGPLADAAVVETMGAS